MSKESFQQRNRDQQKQQQKQMDILELKKYNNWSVETKRVSTTDSIMQNKKNQLSIKQGIQRYPFREKKNEKE